MTYIKPQVIIHQEFEQSAEAEDTTLRACIVGPNAILHRYSDVNEKAQIAIGEYSIADTDSEVVIDSNLGLSTGGVVDPDSIKLYVDNAMLSYYKDLTQTEGEDTPTIHSSYTENNVIVSDSDALIFKTNGSANRAGVCKDVQLGDYVWCQAYVGTDANDTHCARPFVLSKVTGYRYVPEPSAMGTPTTDDTETAETVSTTVEGNDTGKPELTVTGTYNYLVAGDTEPSYTIKISRKTTSVNCALSVMALITNNSTQEAREVEVFEGEGFAIDEYYTGTFDSFTDVAVDQTWTVSSSLEYTPPNLELGGTYTGSIDDTYYFTCIRGGTPSSDSATCPIMSVRTALGLDYVARINAESDDTLAPVGHQGLQFYIDGDIKTGQTYTVEVTAAKEGKINGLELQKDLPATMRSSDSSHIIGLNIRIFSKKNIVLSAKSDTDGFADNFTFISSPLAQKIELNRKISLQDSAFINAAGQPVTLDLFSGDMFLQYREWSPEFVGELNYCGSTADLDLIPGQLDPDNPLKYGIYKALANSNGVAVAYTAVATPDDADAWTSALAVIKGEEGVYSITPMTQDLSILNQVAALIESESGAAQCQWKTGVFSVKLATECMIVGQNKVNNDLFTTSDDGEIVTATFEDNDAIDGEQFTVAVIKSGNVTLTSPDYDVKAGDRLRFMISDTEYEEYIIDRVPTDTTLVLKTGPGMAITTPNRIEIWRTLSKLEQAEYVGDLAGSFGNRRIMVVAPDKVGEDGVLIPGYYVAAAISGYKSGVNAYQGLTRTEISGFDDFRYAKPYWNESQLDTLASHGVCIVLEDANGTPYIRHALTTDMSDVFHREEVITRDYDYICKQIYSILQKYIGKTSVTDKTLDNIYSGVQSLLLNLYQRGCVRNY